jgi:hypothetical protein
MVMSMGKFFPDSGPAGVCAACQREAEHVRGSISHGDDKLCIECFCQWYEPDNGSFDPVNRISLGNYVRKKHGLLPLEDPPIDPARDRA